MNEPTAIDFASFIKIIYLIVCKKFGFVLNIFLFCTPKSGNLSRKI